MNKRSTGQMVEAVFKEIEKCDKLLVKYEEMGDPLILAKQEWTPISTEMLEQKEKLEEMKNKINEHLKQLVNLLNRLIKNETIRCKSCKNLIPLHRLLTIPEAELCLECKLKPLRIPVYSGSRKNI